MLPYSAEQTESWRVQTFAHLLVEEREHVLFLTLNRPEKKNALNATLLNELAYMLSFAHHSAQVWAVVLAAKGDVFCAGADLKAFAGTSDESASSIPPPNDAIIIGNLFAGLHKPCIARLHTPVYAGGLLLVCGCTHVIASPNVFFDLPEVKRGLFPMQVMQSLLQIMSARHVLDWCICARRLDAQQALSNGLVTQLVENPEQLDPAINTLLAEICQNSPSAIRLGLQAFDELKSIAPADAHAYLSNMLFQTLQTQDAAEGISAFQQKRKPVWTGH